MIGARLLATRVRRWFAAGLIALVAAGVAVAAWPSPNDALIVSTPERIEVPAGPGMTGTITLDAGLYLPARTPAPAVIVAHGFGGTRFSVDTDAQRLARAGFVVLTYSARGFGASTGMIALDSLDYEVADARALVNWLAKRPEVLQDGPGDPRVGVTGGSYGGALALMLAGTDHRIDAVAAVATWNNLQQALFPNNIAREQLGSDPPNPSMLATPGTPAYVPGWADGVFKQGWASALLSSILAAKPVRGAAAAGGDDPATSDTAGTGGPGAGAPGTRPVDPTLGCGRLMPDLCAAYIHVAQTGRITPALSALLAKSSPAQVVSDIRAPTLLVQGEADTLFGLDQADANAHAIAVAGTPVAVTWYPGGHNGGPPGVATTDRIDQWLRHYLTGKGTAPSSAFRYSVPGPVAQRGQIRTRTLQVGSYPGFGQPLATRTRLVDLEGPPQVVLNPPGGQPAAITSLPGVSAGLSALGALGALPGQTAVFESEPLTAPLVVTGSIPVTIIVSRIAGADTADGADAVLYLSVASIKPGTAPAGDAARNGSGESSSAGTADLTGALAALGSAPAGGAVAPIRIADLPADGTAATVTVNLPAVAFQVPTGGRLAVRVATTDQGFFGDTAPAAYRIAVAGAKLVVPAVEGTRAPGDEDGQPIGLTIGLGVFVAFAVVGLWVAGRPRRRSATPPGAEHLTGLGDAVASGPERAPLVIRGLAKRYPGGVTAVADVSFTVERGQVLGLLGPNGAGKTTTLRMVMGLITPTAGEIEIFGEPAAPGAPVLSRIGSFVEGSGFLPHLPGAANLELYWRATGRPHADAHIEEALEIADLGSAIGRKVKTYSQGMRQRLAIAQAMLGLPDLLLLDEPTNGLDPPQIHAMREVLRRYAATGRTVLISSHLLSEVEQTCSHVVVMRRGRTIAAGTVAELVAASGEVSIGALDPAGAAAVLRDADGIGDVEVTATGVAADLGALSLTSALRLLLDAGAEITSAAPRNRLEDVFLDLVGNGPAGGESAGGDSATVEAALASTGSQATATDPTSERSVRP